MLCQPGCRMTSAKSIPVALLVAHLIVGGSQASGQGIGGIPFSEIDINGDGSLDAAELIAAFDAAGLSILSRDLSGDGLVTREELRTSRQYTKEDGISVDGSVAPPDGASNRNPANTVAASSNTAAAAATSTNSQDGNRGHGNDADGVDDSNPGRGNGNGSAGSNGAGRGQGSNRRK